MKKYARVFKYLSHYKGEAFLYILFIVLSVLFSLVSLGMLFPFLEMIFTKGKGVTGLGDSSNPVVMWVRQVITDSRANRGDVATLALICTFIIVSILFKKPFSLSSLLYTQSFKK